MRNDVLTCCAAIKLTAASDIVPHTVAASPECMFIERNVCVGGDYVTNYVTPSTRVWKHNTS